MRFVSMTELSAVGKGVIGFIFALGALLQVPEISAPVAEFIHYHPHYAFIVATIAFLTSTLANPTVQKIIGYVPTTQGTLGKPLAMLLVMLIAVVALSGCSSFERTTFQTLSASQAVINQAQVDYEAKTIPQTQAAYKAINAAKAAQTTAVQAMVTYENLKASGATTATLQGQEAIVVTALGAIGPLLADVKALYAAVTAKPVVPVSGVPGITGPITRLWLPKGEAYGYLSVSAQA